MRIDAERFLEHFCDEATTDCPAGISAFDQAQMLTGAGVEPFALGAALRFSPTRTKAVMREVLQHHLLRIEVVTGCDGRNEIRMIPTHETPRWYARVLRARAVESLTATHEPHKGARTTHALQRSPPPRATASRAEVRP